MREPGGSGWGTKERLGSWKERYERLHNAFAGSASLVGSNGVYEYWAASLRSLTGADMVCLRLLSATGSSLIKCATSVAPGSPVVVSRDFVSTSTGRMPGLMSHKKPIEIDFSKPAPEDQYLPDLLEGGHASAISIPIVYGEEVLGVYDAAFCIPPWWDEEDVEYLCEVGRFLGAVVRQSSLRSSAMELCVLEEGRRICSEIHDNLAQLVNTVRLQAERASMSLEEGDQSALAEDIARIEATSCQVVDLVRSELLSLRSAVDGSEDLVEEVASCLERFGKMWHIKTELRLNGAEGVGLGSNAKLQILRVLNEGLTNVYRHAEATKVVVSIECDESFLFLRISDNGKGFDLQAVGSDRLGLRIMRERVEQLGGRFVVESREAEGTKLCAVVPRLK